MQTSERKMPARSILLREVGAAPPLAVHITSVSPSRLPPQRRASSSSTTERSVSPASTATSSGSDVDDGSSDGGSGRGGNAKTSLSSRLRADEVFLRNMVALLNKRGYNVRDVVAQEDSAASNATSLTRSSSMTSTGSAMSSAILALREPQHGQTPLHIAVRKGDSPVLEALLEHESAEQIVDAPDLNGNTALHFSAGNWRLPTCMAITTRLLAVGADVNAQNKRKLTPLAVHMLTLKIDNPTLVAKLLEADADPNTEAEGVPVLHLAARRDFPAVAGVLVAFGASMQALNADGLMCYEVASKRVKQFMVRSIHSPPMYLPLGQRNSCMRCNSPALLASKKVVGNLFKQALGMTVRAHQSNCYHCGLLFCKECLKPSTASEAIPFVRDEDVPVTKIKTCRLCEAVLVERKRKAASQHAFDMHLMGFDRAV